MCTGIVETAEVSGSGKGPHGWFKLEQVNVSFDHSTDAGLEHALNIDFVNPSLGPGAGVAVELDPTSARRLGDAIIAALYRGETVEGLDLAGRTHWLQGWERSCGKEFRIFSSSRTLLA